MKIVEQHINEIHFCVNNRNYIIKLEKPIMAHSYNEMRKYAKMEIERYICNNGIMEPYELNFL